MVTHQIEIISETEINAGWRFGAQVLDENGGMHRCSLTLSWADYNHWSVGGADPPAHVAAAALRFMLEKLGAPKLPETFDASLARRVADDADSRIPALIGPA